MPVSLYKKFNKQKKKVRQRNLSVAISHYRQAIDLDEYYVDGFTDLAIILEVKFGVVIF